MLLVHVSSITSWRAVRCVCLRRGAECQPRHRAGRLSAVPHEGSTRLHRAWRARARSLHAPGRAPGVRLTRRAGARQLLAALWLLRALSRRCRLRFAGRVALAQGVRFLGPTGAPCSLQRCSLAAAAGWRGTRPCRALGPLAQTALPLVLSWTAYGGIRKSMPYAGWAVLSCGSRGMAMLPRSCSQRHFLLSPTACMITGCAKRRCARRPADDTHSGHRRHLCARSIACRTVRRCACRSASGVLAGEPTPGLCALLVAPVAKFAQPCTPCLCHFVSRRCDP